MHDRMRPRIIPRRARETEALLLLDSTSKGSLSLRRPESSGSFPLTASACARYKRGMAESWHRTDILCTMNARMVFPLLLLLAAAVAAPLASGQLAHGFYKTTCPDAEKIIFGIVEKRFKEDPGTAPGLLRLVFHDCFANGCDASILIDPLSNRASEKEAGPNISVKGYDVIDDIKTELEKQCPDVVSCADILTVSARDAVRLTGGPVYEVPTGRRDSLASNREDSDNLPGPEISVPNAISVFAKNGFDAEEMVALLAGGHTIGRCKCFFIETDAAPTDPDYKKNITVTCDGANREKGSVPMDRITPDIFDGNYFELALAKMMPITVDRLMGMDTRTEPILKAMAAKPESFAPIFAKAMEKLSNLHVLTGKDGEVRRSCSEFNNPQQTNDAPSVIRVSSLNPDQMQGLSEPGAREVDSRKVNGGEAANIAATPVTEVNKQAGGEAANIAAPVTEVNKQPGAVAANIAAPVTEVNKQPDGVAAPGSAVNKEAGGVAANTAAPGSAVNKEAGGVAANIAAPVTAANKEAAVAANIAAPVTAANKEAGGVAANIAAPVAAVNKEAGGMAANIAAPVTAANKQPGGVAANIAAPVTEVNKEAGGVAANIAAPVTAANKQPGGVAANIAAPVTEVNKEAGGVAANIAAPVTAANKEAGGVAANIAAPVTEVNKEASGVAANIATPGSTVKKEAANMVKPVTEVNKEAGGGGGEAAKVPANEEVKKKLRGGQL